MCAAGEVGASDGWHASRRTEPYGVTRRLWTSRGDPGAHPDQSSRRSVSEGAASPHGGREICRIWRMPRLLGTDLCHWVWRLQYV